MIPFQAKVPAFKSIAEAIESFPMIAGMKLHSSSALFKTEIMLIDLVQGVIYGIHTEETSPLKDYPSFVERGISYIGIVSAVDFSNGQKAVRLCSTQNIDTLVEALVITQPVLMPFSNSIIHRTIYDINRICRSSGSMILIDARKPPSRFFG